MDDIGWPSEGSFQDDVIAQAVNTVTESGALYFSAAGNAGSKKMGTSSVWEGDFVSGPTTTITTAEGPTPKYQARVASTASIAAGATVNRLTADAPGAITLEWSDPLEASQNDYDLFLLSYDLSSILDVDDTVQSGSQDPFEWIDSSSSDDTDLALLVTRFSGSARYLRVNAEAGQLEYNTVGQIAALALQAHPELIGR